MRFATNSLLALLSAAALGSPRALHAEPAPAASRVIGLDQALGEARAHQPALVAARATRLAAEAQADQMRAGFLPQVAANASYTLSTANFVTRPGSLPNGQVVAGSTSWSTHDYWSLGLSANQLLWDFGQTPGRWRAAQASAEAQGATERATSSDVAFQVRSAFFSARAARSLVRVADETLANQERHFRQIQGFVELGSRPAIDLSQAKADRGNARVQLINAQNQYDVARATLLQAMGVESDIDFELGDETLPPIPDEDAGLETLVDEAVRARPELANLTWLIASQEQTLRATRGTYAPTLSAGTAFSDAGPALDNLVWNWSGGLTLSWSLFQGGATQASVRQSSALIGRARAQLDLERQQIRLDVKQAQLGVRAAKAAREAAGETAAAAADRLRLAEGRYQTGVGNIIELGDAQVAYTAAAAQEVQSEFQLFSARAQLLHALGRP